jgi:dihydroxyacetone kinase-like protein
VDAAHVMDAACAVAWLRVFADEVASRRDELTALDAAIGDADHGANMDRGMRAVVGKLPVVDAEMDADGRTEGADDVAEGAPLGPLFKTAGMTMVSTVGGAAGPLYGTFFLEFGKAAGDRTQLSAHEWAEAFSTSVAGVQARGKAQPGDKTMVDALLPARDAMTAAADDGAPLGDALRAAADAAADGMRATIPLVARKGRASYLGERSAGHQDPGATSSWLLLKTAAAVTGGESHVAGGTPAATGPGGEEADPA